VDIATHERTDGSYLLVLAGEFDVASASDVHKHGFSLINSDRCRRLIVDLMDVSFIDSMGIGALIGLRNAAGAMPVPFTLLDPSARVIKVLEVTGLFDIFDVETTQS
jgi:anti-sigma B factor antagonist